MSVDRVRPGSWTMGPLLCVLAVSSLVACSSSTGSSSGNPPAPAGGNSSTGSSTGSSQTGGGYQLDPAVTTLRVNADAASVKLTAQDAAPAVSVTEQVHGATTTKQVNGTDAVLTSRCPNGITFGTSCRVDYTITVPSRVAVDIEGAAGDIALSGPVTNATVKTSAARITGTGLGAGTIQADNKAGQVDLAFAVAPTSVSVTSETGEVTITVPGSASYNVTAKTTIGSEDVTVNKDPSSAHRIDVTTTIGAVTVKNG